MAKRVLFNAYQPATGVELWITDGTAAGTILLKDINPGAGFSDPVQFTAFRGKALFVADDGVHGPELWLTDGTSAGTVLLKDIRSGSANSSLAGLTVFGDKALFRASDGVNGSELWVTDGTAAGTVMLKDIAPGSLASTPSGFTIFGDKVLFQASDGANGAELWVTDGTAAGTMLLKDINPGSGSSSPERFAVFGDKVLFGASDGVHGLELWVTDGTAAGTLLLKDISTGNSHPSGFTILGDKMLFLAIDTLTGSEVWVTDGTAAGTVMLKDLIPGPQGSAPIGFTPFGDKLLFSAGVNSLFDSELWITDGTAAGTFLVKAINPGTSGSSLAGFKVMGDRMVFQANDGSTGLEAWVTDGTPGGTFLLKDIAPGSTNSFAGGGTTLGDIALFQANDLITGPELWMTDGTAAGTVMVKDLTPGSGGSFPNALTAITFAQSFLEGTAGDDLLAGGTGDDALYGRDGNDRLEGGDGADELEGGDGDDHVEGAGADDLLDGGDGSDILNGGAGNDRLKGRAGADRLDGGAGNDQLDPGRIEGEEEAHGGEGVDSLYATFAQTGAAGLSSSLTANPLGGYDGWIGDGDGLRITFSGIERFSLSGTAAADELAGGSLDDSLRGGGGDDVLAGGDGGDLMDGGSGGDLMTGGAGDDSYRVDDAGDAIVEEEAGGTDEVSTALAAYTLAAHVERLSGAAVGQSLTGNGLDNLITAGAGNDVLDGGAGADRMIGGAGNDRFIVDDSGDVVEDSAGTDEIRTSLAIYGLAAAATVENLTGTLASGQQLTGNSLANTIVGGDGPDELRGEAGADQLVGGGGDDLLDGGAGTDTMRGGAGDDIYHLDDQADVVVEEADGGTDEIRIFDTGSYELPAHVENGTIVAGGWHYLTGNSLANVLTGSDDSDTLNGGAGADTLIGGKGSDYYHIDNVGDVIVEEEDTFWPYADRGDTVVTSLTEYALRSDLENLEGTSAQQRLVGTDRGNRISSGGGQDTLIGGKGDDQYSVYAGDTIVELPDEGIDTVYVSGGGNFTLADNLERLSGQSSSGQVLTGNGLANRIDASSGNDTLDGGAGADDMRGGRGNDIYHVDDAGDVVIEEAGEGTDEVRTSLASYSLLGTNLENLTATSALAHDFRGNSGGNVITGGGGNDLLRLMDSGNDTALGGDGSDVFLFGATLTPLDKVDGGAGRDQIAIQGNYAMTLGSGVVGLESIAILAGSDTRFGDPGTNFYDYDLTTLDVNVAAGVQMIVDASGLRVGEDFRFNGAAETNGSFFIYGGRGVDTLTGGSGNDAFYFGEGMQFGATDVVNGGPGGIDQLGLRGSYTIVFGAGQLVGIENIGLVSAQDTRYGPQGASYNYNLTMSDGNVAAGVQLTLDAFALRGGETLSFNGAAETNGTFRIFGGQGHDNIVTGQGNDILAGNRGADNLTGGGGADMFRFNASADSAPGAVDHIHDFVPGIDKIDLIRIDADTHAAGDQAFHWIGSSAFTGNGAASAGELRAYLDNGNWFIEGDTDGNGVADLRITMTEPATPIGQGDFLL